MKWVLGHKRAIKAEQREPVIVREGCRETSASMRKERKSPRERLAGGGPVLQRSK